ncbi:alpha-1,2-mannosidase [Favolaschia claudopus]|uniref:alpha-1,2-Mannosidase n=1 Tax=Favolaschia claudopus TaxID=2862362 RepID=A0AAW0CFL8_9AGAR
MRLSFSRVVLVLGLSATSLAGVSVQKSGLSVPKQYASRRDQVKDMFKSSYGAYMKYAFPHDDLAPSSTGFWDFTHQWGASVIDAMPTMYIMGLNDLFNDAVKFAASVDFTQSKTGDTVNVFDTTIRFLGPLLSSYELSNFKHPVLLAKAKQSADKLVHAWVGDNPIPYSFLNFTTNQPTNGTSNIAEAGTLLLEWSRLSKYTLNPKYVNLATKAMKHIANLPAPLPGLAAQVIDPATGNFVGGYVSWGSESDSYFEYLIKYARLSNTWDSIYIDTWKTAVDSSIRSLLKKSTVGNHTYLADLDDEGRVLHIGSHLACFHAGNWIYGGKLVQNQTIVNYGLELMEGCWNTYASTTAGIGPERFAYASPDGNFTGEGDPAPTAEQLAFYEKHGFYQTIGFYVLRPEVLESNFYAWRATGDTKYLDRAGAAIDAFNKYLLVPSGGYAGLNDVMNPGAGYWDIADSFWYAETLKYLYLTFDDPKHISLDNYVFNTECSPFKAPPALLSYKGSGGWLPWKPWKVWPTHGEVPAATVSGVPREGRKW